MVKSVISVMTAAVIGTGAVQLSASSLTASANALYTVRFLDYDGNTYYTLSVPAGQRIDSKILDSIDTSGLSRQLDTHTQQRFSSWWGVPDYVNSDVDVKPLSVTGTISLENLPDKKNYFSLESEISKTGLAVNITFQTQTGINADGSYITTKEIVDISSTCTLNYSTAREAFVSDNKATVKVYPINSSNPIGSYDISYHEGFADVDNDNVITGSDATLVLREYTLLSSDPDNYKIDESVLESGDMDFDGVITGSDATLLLRYYTLKSSDPEYTLDKFFDEK